MDWVLSDNFIFFKKKKTQSVIITKTRRFPIQMYVYAFETCILTGVFVEKRVKENLKNLNCSFFQSFCDYTSRQNIGQKKYRSTYG